MTGQGMVMGINRGQKKMKEFVYRLVRFFPVFLQSGETKNQKERSAAVRFFLFFWHQHDKNPT